MVKQKKQTQMQLSAICKKKSKQKKVEKNLAKSPRRKKRVPIDEIPNNYPGKRANPQANLQDSTQVPEWVEMITDLVVGAGYSYSRIAYRMRVSSSTIQKLGTNHARRPRHRIYHRLISVHYKVFHGSYASARAKAYWQQKQAQIEKSED